MKPIHLVYATSNAACTLLFILRMVYSNATTTPSTQGSDWRGRPSSKHTSRGVDFNRRDSSGDVSSSHRILSSGQKSRRIGKGPHKCTTSTGDKDDDENKLKAPRHVVTFLSTLRPAVVSPTVAQ